MRKLFFYPRLAAQNIKNNGKFNIPFIITGVLSAAMFFIIYSLAVSKSLSRTYGGGQLTTILNMAMTVAMIFFTVFLFYTQSFLIKRRKKEFGLFSVLGMEKKHICLTCAFEMLYIALISIVGGVALGALLSKLVYLALLKLLTFSPGVDYEFSPKAVAFTAIVFSCIFLLLLVKTVISVSRQNAVGLLTGGNVGEREPKTKWITAIIGVLTLGAGYYIAVTATNPLNSIELFIIAVILVMIGTYCLFSSGSIAVLKLLRKRQSYYYKAKHFVSVSGMMYRMKQNAVGLANICLLCTAVLVMVSTTVSLYAGMEDLLRNRFPRNVSVSLSTYNSNDMRDEVDETVDKVLASRHINTSNVIRTSELSMATIQSGNSFAECFNSNSYSSPNITNLHFVLLSDYNRLMGENAELEKDEIIFCAVNGTLDGDVINIGDYQLKIKARIPEYATSNRNLAYMVHTFYLIVSDESVVDNACDSLGLVDGLRPYTVYEYSFDTDAPANEQIALHSALTKAFKDLDKRTNDGISVESAEESRSSFFSLYGGMLFIGIFLGLVFMTAAVLIIYYKQVSEGYDDRERYLIMQKVGMSKDEIRRTIRSQVLTVFFLPLITAFIHLAFAFPIITKMLALLNLTNTPLFAMGLVITAAVFSVIYALIYLLTAKAYYKIVSD